MNHESRVVNSNPKERCQARPKKLATLLAKLLTNKVENERIALFFYFDISFLGLVNQEDFKISKWNDHDFYLLTMII